MKIENSIRKAVQNGYIEWHRHALERMMERGISREIVKKVLLSGEIVEEYPDDKPFPTALFLGWFKGDPLHFEPDYRTRRKHES